MDETANKIDGHGGRDVYDFAEWCTLTPLTKISIENTAPVEIPGFTRGPWSRLEKFECAECIV